MIGRKKAADLHEPIAQFVIEKEGRTTFEDTAATPQDEDSILP